MVVLANQSTFFLFHVIANCAQFRLTVARADQAGGGFRANELLELATAGALDTFSDDELDILRQMGLTAQLTVANSDEEECVPAGAAPPQSSEASPAGAFFMNDDDDDCGPIDWKEAVRQTEVEWSCLNSLNTT